MFSFFYGQQNDVLHGLLNYVNKSSHDLQYVIIELIYIISIVVIYIYIYIYHFYLMSHFHDIYIYIYLKNNI